MQAQQSNVEVEKLLAELDSDDDERCIAAAKKIAILKLNNAAIIKALEAIAEKDEVIPVRQAAVIALKSLGTPPVTGSSLDPHLLAKLANKLSRQSIYVQLATGFVGWYVINGLIWQLLGRWDVGLLCFADQRACAHCAGS